MLAEVSTIGGEGGVLARASALEQGFKSMCMLMAQA
jgi:hypothetical protein